MRLRRPAVEERPAEDLFRSRLENQIDLRHPLTQLAGKMPWPALEQALAPNLPADPVEGGRPARQRLTVWWERAERIWRQRPKDKHKLYALHAPEVECISKGKARRPYEFGVKVGIAVTATKGLIVGGAQLPGQSL